MNRKDWLFFGLFLLIVFVDVAAVNIEAIQSIRVITKPSVMSSLILFTFYNKEVLSTRKKKLMLLLLAFLWLGDVFFLSFEDSIFFLLGFSFFLLANMVYIFLFQKKVEYQFGRVLLFSAFVLAYAFFFMRAIVDGVGDYFYPIIFFMIMAFNMLQAAFFRWQQVNRLSFYLVFLGALIFMLSESIVALEKFAEPIPFTDYLIMPTHGIGNFLMIFGLIIEERVLSSLKDD